MSEEELGLCDQSVADWDFLFDLELGSALAAEVAKLQGVDGSLQVFEGICAGIHQVNLGDDSDSPVASWVDLSRQLQSIRYSEVSISRRYRENQGVRWHDVLCDERPYLVFDIGDLSFHRHFGHAWKIDQG